MSRLDRKIRAADAMGLSYGYYIALVYEPAQKAMAASPHKAKFYGPYFYTDEHLFRLWQDGYTDEQIGTKVGVSRQYIQRWRDLLELPSTSKSRVDTKKYRLTTMEDGTYVAIISDNL